MCLLHELKLAASGWTYLSFAPILCEWKMNLFGEKNKPHIEHLMHLALVEREFERSCLLIGFSYLDEL